MLLDLTATVSGHAGLRDRARGLSDRRRRVPRYLPEPASEFAAFLRLVDEELSRDCTIVVVGGAAIGLAYAPDHATTDIDVMPTRNAALWKAVERAHARSKVAIP